MYVVVETVPSKVWRVEQNKYWLDQCLNDIFFSLGEAQKYAAGLNKKESL